MARRIWNPLTDAIDSVGKNIGRVATVSAVLTFIGGSGVLAVVLNAVTRLSTPWIVVLAVALICLIAGLGPVRRWDQRRTKAERLALGQECVDLAQEIPRFLGDMKREAPIRETRFGLDEEARHREWELSTKADFEFRSRTESRFSERFLVRIIGLCQSLEQAAVLSEREFFHIKWLLSNHGYSLDELGMLLAQKARELGVKAQG